MTIVMRKTPTRYRASEEGRSSEYRTQFHDILRLSGDKIKTMDSEPTRTKKVTSFPRKSTRQGLV